jgi:hypothetical protein
MDTKTSAFNHIDARAAKHTPTTPEEAAPEKHPVNLNDVSEENEATVTLAALDSLQGFFQRVRLTNSDYISNRLEATMTRGVQDAVQNFYREKRRTSFLGLPAEIRLKIYGHMDIHNNSGVWYIPGYSPKPGSDDWFVPKHGGSRGEQYAIQEKTRGIRPFLGLYLSCRQVKQEMDDENRIFLEKWFKASVEKMEQDPDVKGLKLEIPFERPLQPILRVPSQFFEKDRYMIRKRVEQGIWTTRGWLTAHMVPMEHVYQAPICLEAVKALARLELNSLSIVPLEDPSSLTPRTMERWIRWVRTFNSAHGCYYGHRVFFLDIFHRNRDREYYQKPPVV